MGSDFDLQELANLRETLGQQRWRAVSDEAQVVAYYLRCHPKVECVRYPGITSDPQFSEAAHMLVGGFGPYVRYSVLGAWCMLQCKGEDPKQTILRLEQSL